MVVSNGTIVTDHLRPVSDEVSDEVSDGVSDEVSDGVSDSIRSSVDRPIHERAVMEQHPGAVTRNVPRGTAATTTGV